MASPWMLCQTGARNSSLVWRSFCKGRGASVSLTSGFHPQSNSQTKRINQDLESALHFPVTDWRPVQGVPRLPLAPMTAGTGIGSSTPCDPVCQDKQEELRQGRRQHLVLTDKRTDGRTEAGGFSVGLRASDRHRGTFGFSGAEADGGERR
ncbi:hypothetical protein L3Q82_012232 [Scortum barcoo]|uniref:Uncharacterized protein n=1 Tax=Scortum barcoo TaxID=214431 RepID=A0ACB8W385_9TELE|nr:hypothetical protein L3Q82_012232 [Scortum barcoo]